MNFADFLTEACAELQPPLSMAGFQPFAAGTWNRRRRDELNIVWLQKHSSEALFCANLGIHYTFLPKAGTESPFDDGTIDFPDCEIKLRLTSHDAAKDQWWPLNQESVHEIAELMTSRGMAIFDSYRLTGPIAELETKVIVSGNLGPLSPLTRVRACLFLARMHEFLGNREKCIEAATAGVLCAGLAVGPKMALKDILKRNANP